MSGQVCDKSFVGRFVIHYITSARPTAACHKMTGWTVYIQAMLLHFFLLPSLLTASSQALLAAAVDPYTLSTGRIGAIIAGLSALAGVFISAQALRRQKSGAGTGRNGAIVAIGA